MKKNNDLEETESRKNKIMLLVCAIGLIFVLSPIIYIDSSASAHNTPLAAGNASRPATLSSHAPQNAATNHTSLRPFTSAPEKNNDIWFLSADSTSWMLV